MLFSRICGRVLTIGFNRISIKWDRLLVGELNDETIGRTEMGFL